MTQSTLKLYGVKMYNFREAKCRTILKYKILSIKRDGSLQNRKFLLFLENVQRKWLYTGDFVVKKQISRG